MRCLVMSRAGRVAVSPIVRVVAPRSSCHSGAADWSRTLTPLVGQCDYRAFLLAITGQEYGKEQAAHWSSPFPPIAV